MCLFLIIGLSTPNLTEQANHILPFLEAETNNPKFQNLKGRRHRLARAATRGILPPGMCAVRYEVPKKEVNKLAWLQKQNGIFVVSLKNLPHAYCVSGQVIIDIQPTRCTQTDVIQEAYIVRKKVAKRKFHIYI